MKKFVTLMLAAGMLFGAATGASAIDFKAKGQWIMGFGAVDSNFTPKVNGKNNYNGDQFGAMQRLRLQMDAVASESLSGTVFFEIGDTTWGKAGSSGGALGADGKIVELKNAYIDWAVPNTALKFRMGIQAIDMPSVAGGSAILADDVAGITANYKFNDNVSLTALWLRPFNDNYTNPSNTSFSNPTGYLDNVDFFAVTLPITLEGWKITPWAMIGGSGRNGLEGSPAEVKNGRVIEEGNNFYSGTLPFGYSNDQQARNNAYSTVFWAGLPIAFTGLDPWNFELDLNYGATDGFGRYTHTDVFGTSRRADTQRQGWLAKALVEYKMDWGTPGLFGWYGSGDDGDVKNGSERMPTFSPGGNMTSFMGDGAERGWSIYSGRNFGYDIMMSYSGTWGIGAQLKDLTFLEGLKHTLRVAYWGGTNSPEMVKQLNATAATDRVGSGMAEGVYLTTNDGLLEFNVDSTYKIYDNLTVTLELGYIANLIDQGTWERYYMNDRFQKGDAYKAALIFNYSF